MTQEQITQLLRLLEGIATRQYTITGASDWPMLVILFGMFGGVMLLMIGGGIGYLCNGMARDRKENREDHEKLWRSQADCQDACCPKGHGRRAEDGRV